MQDVPCNRAVHPPIRSRGLDNVQTRGERAARLHDATFAFDHEDNLDGQSDKQGNTRTDRAAIYGRSSDQKESPVDWTPHEDVTRQATKAGSLLSTVFWSQKERAPSSPVQGYHLVSNDGSNLCRIATGSTMVQRTGVCTFYDV